MPDMTTSSIGTSLADEDGCVQPTVSEDSRHRGTPGCQELAAGLAVGLKMSTSTVFPIVNISR